MPYKLTNTVKSKPQAKPQKQSKRPTNTVSASALTSKLVTPDPQNSAAMLNKGGGGKHTYDTDRRNEKKIHIRMIPQWTHANETNRRKEKKRKIHRRQIYESGNNDFFLKKIEVRFYCHKLIRNVTHKHN